MSDYSNWLGQFIWLEKKTDELISESKSFVVCCYFKCILRHCEKSLINWIVKFYTKLKVSYLEAKGQ